MNIYQKFLTKNDCYKQNIKMTPKGVMVHSTATPGIMNADWYARWNVSGLAKCVHAFVDDGGTMQCLPWDTLGWHSGVGSLGKAKNANNNGYIGFEICEPKGHTYSGGTMVNYDPAKNQAYFDAVYKEAVELAAYLCKAYNIPPEKPYLIDHTEGNALGIASNHSDVMQWFPKHGKSMDTFRADVKKILNGGELPKEETKVRYFKLKEEMNFRATPNGTKLAVIPKDATVSGTETTTVNGVTWLFTSYNGKAGYVAVLPASKNYATEIDAPKPVTDDYKSKYETEKKRADELSAKIEQIKKIVG